MKKEIASIMLGLIFIVIGISTFILIRQRVSLIFTIVGLLLIIFELKSIIVNSITDSKGIICYGIIQEVGDATLEVNHEKISFPVKVSVCMDNGMIKDFRDNIEDKNKYSRGTIVKVKYYKNDINIIDKIESFNEIPNDAQDALKYINDVMVRSQSIN